MDAGTVDPAEVLIDGGAVDADVRRVSSIEVDAETLATVEATLDAARARIGQAFGVAISGREGAGLLRYAAGGFYLPHVDCADSEEWPDAARRRIAVVVFLNESFGGGALHIIGEERRIRGVTGRLVAFDAALLHEVEPVTRGTRDVIVDWFY